MFKRTLSADKLRRPWTAAIAALALAVVLQPGVSAQEQDAHAAVDRNGPVRIEINSANWMDTHVYVVQDGMVRSLGLVMGPATTTLSLPAMATLPGSALRLMVLPIGRNEMYVSEPFYADPGDLVKLQIENNLALSNVVIAPRG